MSHPLPIHPPSTPPLEEGDIVYKFICPVNERKLKADFQILRHMHDVEILDMHYGGGETITYDLITNKLVLVDTSYIGTIAGSRKKGSQHPDLTPEFMIGYDVRWECNGNYLMVHFEDEQSIISLERLEPMTPEQIKNYLLYGQKRLASK